MSQDMNFTSLPLEQQLDLYEHNQVVWKDQASYSTFKEMRLKVAENPDVDFLNGFLIKELDYDVRLAIIRNPKFVMEESVKRRFAGSSDYEKRMVLANYNKLTQDYLFKMLKKEFEVYKTLNVIDEILNNPNFVITEEVKKYLEGKRYRLKAKH